MLDKFRRLGVRYIRNLSDESQRGEPHFYNSWQDSFSTKSMEEALACHTESTQVSKRDDGCSLKQINCASAFHHDPAYGKLLVTTILSRHGSSFDGHPIFGN